jgi:hypothetical protein
MMHESMVFRGEKSMRGNVYLFDFLIGKSDKNCAVNRWAMSFSGQSSFRWTRRARCDSRRCDNSTRPVDYAAMCELTCDRSHRDVAETGDVESRLRGPRISGIDDCGDREGVARKHGDA